MLISITAQCHPKIQKITVFPFAPDPIPGLNLTPQLRPGNLTISSNRMSSRINEASKVNYHILKLYLAETKVITSCRILGAFMQQIQMQIVKITIHFDFSDTIY